MSEAGPRGRRQPVEAKTAVGDTEVMLGLEGKGTAGGSSSSAKGTAGGSSSSAAGSAAEALADAKNGHSKVATQDDIEEVADVGGASLKEGAKLQADAKTASGEDTNIELPRPKRDDWESDMKMFRSKAAEEKVTEAIVLELYNALVDRIEDVRAIEEFQAMLGRRLQDAKTEKDGYSTEVSRVKDQKAALEKSCRHLQEEKLNYGKENERLVEEEQTRHTELKDRFQQAIKDVEEKMNAELEVREHFLKENTELRGKLEKFTETYEAQERQLAEERESRMKEMEAAQNRLTEHETMCAESKANATDLERENEGLKKSTNNLRQELQTILGRFDKFHEDVTKSNQLHGDCKVEIDRLQAELQEMEKKNAELKAPAELQKLQEEQQVAHKQREQLEKLCDNLTKDNRKVQETLNSLRRKKTSGS